MIAFTRGSIKFFFCVILAVMFSLKIRLCPIWYRIELGKLHVRLVSDSLAPVARILIRTKIALPRKQLFVSSAINHQRVLLNTAKDLKSMY